jgi:DNA modification methylase
VAKPQKKAFSLSSLADLRPDPDNPREITTDALAGLQASVANFGDISGIVWNRRTGQLVAGHQRLQALQERYGAAASLEIGEDDDHVGVRISSGGYFPVRVVDWPLERQRLANLAANNPHIAGAFTRELQPQLHGLLAKEEELFRSLRLDQMLAAELEAIAPKANLAEKFLIPPFSIFDTRKGYWQDRRRQWLSLGIQSEIGRGANLLKFSETVLEPDPKKRAAKAKEYARKFGQDFSKNWKKDHFKKDSPNAHLNESAQKALGFYASYQGADALERGNGSYTGTSIFDPVLAEIIYKWFSPSGAAILDPFAGGSVRGIVAGVCGRKYTGIDLRREQTDANQAQAETIFQDRKPERGKKPSKGKAETPEEQPEAPATITISSAMPRPVWHFGDSQALDTILPKGAEFDLVFSCPPYFDLEQYSDDPADLSNLSWADFLAKYQTIIAKAGARLRDNRFACFVVGEVRDKKGFYRHFVGETIRAFEAAGLHFYNEIILVNTAGSLPLRIGRQFQNYRKVGKMHQNVLVFFKGDPKRIRPDFGEVEVAQAEELAPDEAVATEEAPDNGGD